jgi:hypothetical protein
LFAPAGSLSLASVVDWRLASGVDWRLESLRLPAAVNGLLFTNQPSHIRQKEAKENHLHNTPLLLYPNLFEQ